MKTGNVKNWQCLVCGHVAEGDTPPDVCPVCGVGPDQFEEIAVSNTGFMSEKKKASLSLEMELQEQCWQK